MEGRSCLGPICETQAHQVGPQCWDWRPLEPGLPLSVRLLLAIYQHNLHLNNKNFIILHNRPRGGPDSRDH